MDEYIDQIERETMQLIERGESIGQAWLSGVTAVAEQIAPLVPELPATPFTALMPKPADVVKSSFTVMGRLLEASRRLAECSVDAIAPGDVRADAVDERESVEEERAEGRGNSEPRGGLSRWPERSALSVFARPVSMYRQRYGKGCPNTQLAFGEDSTSVTLRDVPHDR